MAKHKKRGRKSKKELAEKKKSSSSFWRQVYAFIMILVALLIMIGGFGGGGEGPKKIFSVFAKAFGFAAYFTPVMIAYWAILKFKNEKHKTPLGRIVGGCFVLIAMSALLHVFVSKENSLNFANKGVYGGYIGYSVNSIFSGIFTNTTAFIVYAVFLLIAFLFTFSITPKNFLNFIISIFKLEDKEETQEQNDAKNIASKANPNQSSKLSIHENVPIEHGEANEKEKTPVKVASFRNTAQKLTPVENHEALTVRSDPNWKFPGLDLLNRTQDKADPGNIQQNADIIKETLANFNINVEMEGANVGPRVTQFTLKPPNGVKLQKITALDSNIALDLAAQSIRIEAPIPGKRAVGVEIPNLRAATVRMASVIDSNEWRGLKNPLGFAIGKDITGQSVVGAIDKMPHLLIAGQTGSGKSVMINVLLTSLLYKCSPSDLKLILVDPKQVELKPYEDIPHLLTPVITEPEKCISALKWAVAEMERRLRTMAEKGKRDIKQYNESFAAEGEGMPYIVIVIDELSDLMMMAARDVEALVVRIAQKARAAGIHLVLATQRPSVNVITGLIKANVPGRIAFTTQSRVDSATILDSIGAEKLLGMGDMLLKTSEMPQPIRIQGALITEAETMKVTDFLRDQQPPNYDDEVVSQTVTLNGKGGIVADSGSDSVDDSAWQDAVRVVIESQKASTSYLQRRLRIGYGRAARLIETMEEQGIVGPADGSRPREVLVRSMDDLASASDSTSAEDIESEEAVPVNVRFD